MIYTLLYIGLGVSIISIFGGACIKDPVIAKALRVVGVLCVAMSLLLLIGCHVILSGMRIE